MKRIFVNSLITAAALAGMFATAQETETRTTSVFVSATNSVTATVEDVDYEKRRVILKGPGGNTVQLRASDAVKNFEQIKKGDEVVANYYEALAVNLAKPGEPRRGKTEGKSVLVAPPGEKPSRLEVETTELTAVVDDIDRKKREVTLKGPEGNKVKVKIDPAVGDLENIKEGDQLNIAYTEALAVSVEKSRK